MVFNCTTWAQTADVKISETHYDLNQYYAPVGLQFNAYVTYYRCSGTDGTMDYSTFDSNGNKVTQAITKERGSNYKNEGGFIVVAGVPQDPSLNGFFYLPLTGYSYAGCGFMGTHVIGAGFTTLAHELGHGFALHHTFKGVSEDAGCACPEATASDLRGDYCADTPPVARNWECTSPLSATGSFQDPCTSRSSYTNPFDNLMSYGTCRNKFTASQIKRIRCYRIKNLSWVIADTNPLKNYTQGTPSKPDPINPNASMSITYSLFIFVGCIVAALF
jgi:hypothetical protein